MSKTTQQWRCSVGDHQWTAIGERKVCVFCKHVRGPEDEFPEDYPAAAVERESFASAVRFWGDQ